MMSNPGARMGLRRAPFAFTEHGALMAATVLNSPRAVEISLYVVRTFMRMREVLATRIALASQLALLEQQTAAWTRGGGADDLDGSGLQGCGAPGQNIS